MLRQLSTVRKVTLVALLLCALSVVIQKIMGVTDYPPVPPAIIILLIASFMLWRFPGRRWATAIGFIIPLSLVVGMTIDRWYEKLGQPSYVGYPGIVLQWASLIVGLIGVIILLRQDFARRP